MVGDCRFVLSKQLERGCAIVEFVLSLTVREADRDVVACIWLLPSATSSLNETESDTLFLIISTLEFCRSNTASDGLVEKDKELIELESVGSMVGSHCPCVHEVAPWSFPLHCLHLCIHLQDVFEHPCPLKYLQYVLEIGCLDL